MKIITFNANGIRSAANKGFFTWLAKEEPDFVCIQETKAQIEQLNNDVFFPANFHCEYYDAIKKGYSGVAIYAKHKPLKVTRGLGFATCDTEGRYIQFDYNNFSIVSIYLPSGTSGDERQQVKYNFLDKLKEHLITLNKNGQELIICGDYNIAHQNIDIKNWKSNQQHSGFLPRERAWLDELFGPMGYADAFRVLNKEANQYTWWSNRANSWENNVGWRIDYQVITKEFIKRVKSTTIYRETKFSDHAPLIITYAVDI